MPIRTPLFRVIGFVVLCFSFCAVISDSEGPSKVRLYRIASSRLGDDQRGSVALQTQDGTRRIFYVRGWFWWEVEDPQQNIHGFLTDVKNHRQKVSL